MNHLGSEVQVLQIQELPIHPPISVLGSTGHGHELMSTCAGQVLSVVAAVGLLSPAFVAPAATSPKVGNRMRSS